MISDGSFEIGTNSGRQLLTAQVVRKNQILTRKPVFPFGMDLFARDLHKALT